MANKVTEVAVNYGVTVNSGIKYEFIRLDFQAKRQICEGEDPIDLMHKLHRRLKVEVNKAVDMEINGQ